MRPQIRDYEATESDVVWQHFLPIIAKTDPFNDKATMVEVPVWRLDELHAYIDKRIKLIDQPES